MNNTKFKPSLLVNSLLGDELAKDSEDFVLFLKAYYEWLQTTKLTIKSRQGTFQKNEVLIGQSSGSSAKIQEVGTDYLVVTVTTEKVFLLNEQIVGQTSTANAIVSIVKDNVVRSTGKLIDNRSIDHSVDRYSEYLREELYSTIPLEYIGNKRLVAKKFRDYFESKGNEESYRFLFKLLYNEPIEFYYPGLDVLRVSDGKFEKTRILRVAVNARIFEFLDKTIRGKTSNALANVVDIKTFFIGSIEIAEFTVSLVSGTFSAYEDIEDIEDETLITTTYGIIADFNILDGGSGYVVGDPVVITGDGAEAQAFVSSVKDSPITAIKVNAVGYGYRNGTTAIVNNSGTGGSGFLLRVGEIKEPYQAGGYTVGEIQKLLIINRGTGYLKAPTITLRDVEVSALGMLTEKLVTIDNSGTDYGVGNTLSIVGGSGSAAAGQVASVVESITYDLLFEDDSRIIADGSYEDIIKNEDWSVLGPVSRIEFTNFGTGYTSNNLPTITVNSTTGSNASFTVTGIQGETADVEVDTSNNIVGLGSIRDIVITNFGINYSSANADLSASGDGNAIIEPIISGLGVKEGNWVGDDGKIDYKIIQDSFFYQDFSYAIRSSLTFNKYKDILLKTVHPAGFQPFGQILITTFFNLSPNFVTQIETTSPEIDTLLLQIRSFFSVAVSNPFNGSRMELDLPRIQVNGEIVNTDSRFLTILFHPELDLKFNANGNYIITPTFDGLQDLIDTDRQVKLVTKHDTIDRTISVDKQFKIVPDHDPVIVQSTFDTTKLEYEINPKINTAIDTPVAKVNLSLNVNIDGPKYSSFQYKDVKIGNISQYDPNNSNLIFNFKDIRFDEYIAPTTKFTVQVAKDEILASLNYDDSVFTRIKKIESSANLVSADTFKSYNLYNYSKTDASMSGNLISDLSYKIIPQTIDGAFNLSSSKYKIESKNENSVSSSVARTKYLINSGHEVLDLTSNTITQSFGIFANATISQFSLEPIVTFGIYSLNDPISFGSAIKNVKISGTVVVSGNVVIGTNTQFDQELIVNESIIIDKTEKFIINSISNSTFMTLNVPATGSYVDVSAYKENL